MDPNADLDKLERMLAMKERVEGQNAKVSFSRALSEARASIPPIVKDATVDFKSAKGHTHYKHETLAGIAKVIDPILSQHGLSYRFRTDQGQGGVRVTCIIQHADGHSEETSLSGAPDGSGSKNSFQAVGSAVTYLQRYTLKAALGLSAEVDDDGRSASRPINDAPRFDARAAADAVVTKINRAADLSELSEVWRSEQDALKRIEAADAIAYADAIRAKDGRKAELTPLPAADLGDDEIPY